VEPLQSQDIGKKKKEKFNITRAQKKKYLKGKIGIEKKPFQLPDFIEATGIAEIRDNKKKSLKIQARERMNPKLGKLDIDYQILHDAFFKYQKKSKLTNFGELYYEGREYEIKLKHLQPGKLTDRLKKALGMPTNENDVPPPWLINMQQVTFISFNSKVWTSSFLSKFENTWFECTNTRRSTMGIPSKFEFEFL
jgi:hypothetical protein